VVAFSYSHTGAEHTMHIGLCMVFSHTSIVSMKQLGWEYIQGQWANSAAVAAPHLHHACCVFGVARPERQLLQEDEGGELLRRLVRGAAAETSSRQGITTASPQSPQSLLAGPHVALLPCLLMAITGPAPPRSTALHMRCFVHCAATSRFSDICLEGGSTHFRAARTAPVIDDGARLPSLF